MLSRPPMSVSMMNWRSPIAPSSSSARTRRLIGSRRKFSATDRMRPASSAASMIRVAAADGQRQRLLAQRVQAEVEQRVAARWCEPVSVGAVGGLQAVDLAHHRARRPEDARAFAEQLLGLVGQILGVCRFEVADRDELEVHMCRCATAPPDRPGAAAPSRRSRRWPVELDRP